MPLSFSNLKRFMSPNTLSLMPLSFFNLKRFFISLNALSLSFSKSKKVSSVFKYFVSIVNFFLMSLVVLFLFIHSDARINMPL